MKIVGENLHFLLIKTVIYREFDVKRNKKGLIKII